jgi:calcineurin-like phosphoesterase family protein
MKLTEYRSGIWFTSDTHFSHKNIVKYNTKRQEHLGLNLEDENMLAKHDAALIKLWNETVRKTDTVYILGDFSFASVDDTRRILEKLNGKKHLIIGNHDGSCKSLINYFESTSQIKEITFKKTVFPFLDEHMHCVLCHFPMIAWNRRMHGSVMLHGHTHGSVCELNKNSEELRLDIGLDSQLAKGNLISLEQIYRFMKNEIAKGKTFEEHINYLTEKTGFRA